MTTKPPYRQHSHRPSVDDYCAEWDAAVHRWQQELLIDALIWDTEAALAGNPTARAALPTYGTQRHRCAPRSSRARERQP